MTAMVLGAAVGLVIVIAVSGMLRHARPGHVTPHPVRFDTPVIDERTDRDLRARYLRGQIGIDVYLDRRYGTAFSTSAGSTTGDRPAAG